MNRLLLPLFFVNSLCLAEQVITVHDRVKLNWSTHSVVFHGIAQNRASEFASLQETAWDDGLAHLRRTLPQIRAKHPTPSPVNNAQLSIFRFIHLKDTVFFANQRVETIFATTLPRVFHSPRLAFRPAINNLQRSSHSGLILTSKREFPPLALYEVRGISGQKFYDVSQVAEKSFTRNLMGRYFRNVRASDISHFVGKNPHSLPVRYRPPATLEVDETRWQKFAATNARVLATARIAIVF